MITRYVCAHAEEYLIKDINNMFIYYNFVSVVGGGFQSAILVSS